MRVIVPGASGFVGKNLVMKVPSDWEMVATYNNDASFPHFVKVQKPNSNIVVQKCNLLQLDEIQVLRRRCGENFDLCIFLAANSDPSKSHINPGFDLRSNAVALLNFLSTINVKKFIFFSSGSVYEGYKGMVSPEKCVSPSLPYAVSKLAAESYVKHFKRIGIISEYLIVRFFGAYGPYEPKRKVYTKLVNQFYFNHKAEFTIRGNGLNLIDAMYVDDAVEGVLKMVNAPLLDSTIDFCAGAPLSIRDLVIKAGEILCGFKPKLMTEGETVEFNEFYANPKHFAKRYNFKPRINLKEGFLKLAKFLEPIQK